MNEDNIPINIASNDRERLHLRYMGTRKVGDSDGQVYNPQEDLERFYCWFKRKYGVTFLDWYIDQKMQVVLDGADYMRVRELDSVVKKMVGDRQSTEVSVKGVSREEREEIAEEFLSRLKTGEEEEE